MRPPLNITFAEHRECWGPDVPSPVRQEAFYTLSTGEQEVCWRGLANTCRQELEDEYAYEQRLREEWPAKRSSPHLGTATSTSTGASRVEFDHDDPLKRIPASEYLPVIAGVEVSSSGRCRCPMPDHEDMHPSCKVYDTILWHCFGCNEGGDIIKVAEAIYGIPAKGRDFWRLRDRILEALVWAPLHGERNR